MPNFLPGKIVKEFTTKKGHAAQIMYPKWELLDQTIEYVNHLSAEDTFVSLSGEQMTRESEAKFLARAFIEMELQEAVFLLVLIDGKVAGLCQVEQVKELKKRSLHVGKFGIGISQEFRGEGLGYELAHATIAEAARMIPGLRTVVLGCFASNAPAMALYKKLGFTETGRTPDEILHRGQYVDHVQMTLQLASFMASR